MEPASCRCSFGWTLGVVCQLYRWDLAISRGNDKLLDYNLVNFQSCLFACLLLYFRCATPAYRPPLVLVIRLRVGLWSAMV